MKKVIEEKDNIIYMNIKQMPINLLKELDMAHKLININREIIWLDSLFESGNIDGYSIIKKNQEYKKTKIDIILRGDSNDVICGIDMNWFMFRVESTEDQELHFRILNYSMDDRKAVMISRNENGV